MLLVIRNEKEALAMTRWGVALAKATEQELFILWVVSGKKSNSQLLDVEFGSIKEKVSRIESLNWLYDVKER